MMWSQKWEPSKKNALPEPPTYEEVTELCAELSAEAARKWRYRQRLTVAFLLGFCLMPFLMFGAGSILSAIGGFGVLLLMGCVLASFGLAISFRSERIMKRLALTRDTRAVVPLLDIMRGAAEMRHTDVYSNRLLWNTLAFLLPRLSDAEAKAVLAQYGEDVRLFLMDLPSPRVVVTPAQAAVGSAMLDLIRRCKDTKPFATVKALANCPARGQNLQTLQRAAQMCLVVLEEQKLKEEQGRVLLRAAEIVPSEQPDTLLRPAGYQQTTDAQELLRATQ